MTRSELPSERHYRFHLRRMSLGLAFSVAVGAAMIVALLRPGVQVGLVITPGLVFIVSMVALNVALRGRSWRHPDFEERRIWSDERIKANADRARRTALHGLYLAQVPLIPLVVYAQPEPASAEAAATGMALLTMAAGGATFFGSYLRLSWLDAHG